MTDTDTSMLVDMSAEHLQQSIHMVPVVDLMTDKIVALSSLPARYTKGSQPLALSTTEQSCKFWVVRQPLPSSSKD